ncbi:transporter substrate-binding domain-containing protein [Consotaella aegiceratis]|uniref:transporter substrate-binding domain-containing protein n=1 Tax=Consotaella aegiceratis TaxID=3097961 RepID=UPI002F3FA038
MAISVLLAVPPAIAESVAIPNFWDQHQRRVAPSLADRTRLRFLTSVDFPPFNFLDERGRLAGFHVDLVRAICAELDIADRCQIEAMPFRDLVPSIQEREGDAIIAGLAITPDNRRSFAFTEPYFRFPARFVTRKDESFAEPLGQSLQGHKVAVVRNSAHEAMAAAFFPQLTRQPYASRGLALAALKSGEADAFFGDGVDLSFWLSSNDADDCCTFAGGPYLSDRYLGEGLAIAVPLGDAALVDALDYAIGRVVASGRFSELMLRYFPVSAF